jgi:hypothetical protein
MEEKKWHCLNVYLNERDYKAFEQAYAATSHRSHSSFARALLIRKPVKIIYRNRSVDDFIETAVKLRKELKLLLSRETFSQEEKAELSRQIASIQENLIKVVDLCGQK